MKLNVKPLRSVRGRLLLAAVVVEAVMLTLLIGNSLRLLREHMGEQERRQALQIEPVLNAALVAPLAQRDFATLQAILDESRAVKGVEYLAVLDTHDKIVAISGWPRDRALPAPSPVLDVSAADRQPRYDVQRPISLAGQALGTLRFGLDLSHIVVANRQLMVQGAAIAFGELVLSTALLTLLGFWLTRHLVALTRASEQVTAGNLNPPRVHEGEDELGRLGSAFNAMSCAIDERIRDLTEARDAQRNLAAELDVSRARLDSLLSAMKFGVLFADNDARVRYANPEFRAMWALAESDLAGMSVRDVTARFKAKLVADAAPAPVAEGTDGVCEFAFTDGRIITQRDFPVRDQDDRGVGCLWIYEDVTGARHAARQLHAAKEAAEAASVAKAAFLATMSHEIRTPMNGIIGMTELALVASPTPEQKGYLDWVRSSAESLMVILNDILDFSKIDAGRMELESVDFDLTRLLDDTVAIFSRLAKEKGIYLRLEKHADTPAWIKGDPVRLRQVLSNLISNAVKFTERGGVTVLVGSACGPTPVLRFGVADTGIGIAPDKLEHVFSPFSQADSSTTRKYGGTGLGLAIVSRLAELMGGRIWATSEPGRGTCFNFELAFVPAVAGQQKDSDLPPVLADRIVAEGASILVVEDTPVNQVLVTKILKKNGYQVTLAKDGLEALDAFAGAPFDLILMDMQMPNMDGIEATQRIRELSVDAPTRIPIIALTANAMASDRERCLSAGMDDFISKPFRAGEVIEVIRRFLPEAAVAAV